MRMVKLFFRVACVAAILGLLTPSITVAIDDRQIEMLELKIDELRREIDQLKAERATETVPFSDPIKAIGDKPSAPTDVATLETLASRVQIGGYGSLRFEENFADDEHATFTFRRFVLTTDAAVAPKLRFYLELEFERFRLLELERSVRPEAGGLKVEQEIEGTSDSEIALEQVWLEFAFMEQLRLRAGGVLVPLGRFNINHDDNRWDLPRRSLVDRGVPILPVKSAWNELGVGFTGMVEAGADAILDYQIYVVNGATLEPEVEEIIQTRSERRDKLELEAKFTPFTGTFGNDVKDEKAVTGRLMLSPALGHEAAGSFYWGRYTPSFLPSENLTAFAFDGLTTWGPFELEGEFVYTDFGDVVDVARAFARTAGDSSAANPKETNPNFEAEIEFELASLAESRYGYWLEPRWRFRPQWLRESFLGRPFEDPVLTAVIRWEQAWVDGLIQELKFADGEVTELDQVDHRIDRISIGGSYRPVPLVVFQLMYEYTRVDSGQLNDATNFLATSDDDAHAIILGTAFGF